MSYYYFMASLPLLHLEASPPFSIATFHEMVSSILGDERAYELDEILRGTTEGRHSRETREGLMRLRQLQNEIARHRAARLGVDAAPFLKETDCVDVFLVGAVERAFAYPDPLSVERALDTCRWTVLEDMATEQPFSWSGVIAYALQLQLVHRWNTMKASLGRDKLKEAVYQYTQQAARAKAS